ncbi:MULTISPECIES: MFS transporter [unclassified Crossiella]|uniref:spinster family MFS transporter n=1 Tax=unclassified Crossiella TaxID=2620835 RepID=UPI001FFFDFD6|nr:MULTISPECIES: MFS transporter [unclassified Crossiella]MCK2238993.1 MFS transporter [Crossiella sp. S99.2]MCK2251438.1 MFS transporter [Crossiella sp. S99.1]
MAAKDNRTDALLASPPGRGVSSPGGILSLLFAANLLNFYDRTIPAIVVEPLKAEFLLTDTHIGVLSGAFTVVYALFGIPLGRLADRGSRRTILVTGLLFWSLLTAATGLVGGFISLLVVRMLVGVGEASFAPAANSVLADLYPARRRARATALLQLGLPLGLVLAFFTVGPITELSGTWRTAFFIAAVPGLFVAALMLFIREPARGAAEPVAPPPGVVAQAFRKVLRIRTLWWLTLAGVGAQIAAYAVATFSVPLFQRYFGTTLATGGMLTGVVIGLTGLAGLVIGGKLADRASRHSPAGRVYTGAIALLLAAPLTFAALSLGPDSVGWFVLLFSAGWLLQYMYYTSVYPALADVVEPRLRATAISVFFAAFYLLGGFTGPVIAGALSDRFAAAAVGLSPARAAAEGLSQSLMIVIPLGLLLTSIGLFGAARKVTADSARMRAETGG